MRRLAVLIALVIAALGVQSANAATVTRQDRADRVITFDVRARAAPVNWYAAALRNAIHGDEIEWVVVRVVPARQIPRICGRQAASCYEGGGRDEAVLTIPSGQSGEIAHSLLHEYAHHIDTSRSGWRRWEEQWQQSWWSARRMETLLARGRVSFEYELGWGHSIPEIFAEDYVQLHLRTAYEIRWLARPSPGVKAALRRDLRRQSQESTIG